MKYITCVMGTVHDDVARGREIGITWNYDELHGTTLSAGNPLGDTRWASANMTRSLQAIARSVHSSKGPLVPTKKFIRPYLFGLLARSCIPKVAVNAMGTDEKPPAISRSWDSGGKMLLLSSLRVWSIV